MLYATLLNELEDTDSCMHAASNTSRYFDVSKNAQLRSLSLEIQVKSQNESCLCIPAIEVLSLVASSCISHVYIDLNAFHKEGAERGVDLEKLFNGFARLDQVFSRPMFDNLTAVSLSVNMLDERASSEDLRAETE